MADPAGQARLLQKYVSLGWAVEDHQQDSGEAGTAACNGRRCGGVSGFRDSRGGIGPVQEGHACRQGR